MQERTTTSRDKRERARAADYAERYDGPGGVVGKAHRRPSHRGVIDRRCRGLRFPFIPARYRTVAEMSVNVPVRVFGLGTVEARVLSKVGFEVGAAVTELNADHGDTVSQGTVLARLQTTQQEAKVARAKAAVLSA